MTRELAESFDLKQLPDDFYDDPFRYYRALREHAPVKRLRDGGVFLTRYSDVLGIYQDAASFSSDKKQEFAPKYGRDSRLFRHHTTSLVFNDAPYHTRVRRAIMGALIPARWRRWSRNSKHSSRGFWIKPKKPAGWMRSPTSPPRFRSR